MPPSRHQQRSWPTAEEREARRQLTTQRIRGLSSEDTRRLLEYLMDRNEITGILVHSQEFVDNIKNPEWKPPSW